MPSHRRSFRRCFRAAAIAVPLVILASLRSSPDNEVTLELPSSHDHPRNSEGAFAALHSGRIIFYYSQFSGGASDFSPSDIAGVYSDNGGLSWSQPQLIIPRGKNLNLTDVSLLRLPDGRLAMIYDVTEADITVCRPYIRWSSDEGATWSEPSCLIRMPGWFVINNDRAIRTDEGRMVLPIAFHRLTNAPQFNGETSVVGPGTALWYLSDDDGKSWREAKTEWNMPIASQSGLQEPGVEELADGTLYSWARTDQGTQYAMRSYDGGETWTPPQRTELKSPLSPASIKRLPASRALLALFNDHSGRFPYPSEPRTSYSRSPLVAALSIDGGKTWPLRKPIESDLRSNYHYASIFFLNDAVLFAYSFQPPGGPALGSLRVRRVSWRWLLQDAP